MAGFVVVTMAAVITAGMMIWKMRKQRRDVCEFAARLEQSLDCIVQGRKLEREEKFEDTLWERVYEKLCRTEHIWEKRKEEAENEKKVIKELISDISHQTKTPIANLTLYMEFLGDEQLSAQGQEFLKDMKLQTEKLDFLLQSMVKMSRLETGIIKIRSRRTQIQKTILQAVEAIVPKAEKKNIRLSVDCSRELLLLHDEKWTEEAIFNLLDNAVKYTPEGGAVRVSVTRQEIFTRISIRDSGKGIKTERQAQIFTRFYREPEVHEEEGIGIGLYLAREIITMQKGYIEVRSEEGAGSQFSIYLPNA